LQYRANKNPNHLVHKITEPSKQPHTTQTTMADIKTLFIFIFAALLAAVASATGEDARTMLRAASREL
jgi:hypothetical protein